MTFRHPIVIRFGDADPAGIAYYPRIVEICHQAFEEFFEDATGLRYAVAFVQDAIGFPTVALEAEFRAPMKLGDAVVVEVDVLAVGKRSVTFEYRFVGADGGLRARVKNVTVAVDRERFRSVDLPAAWAAAFRARVR
ncbi:MAG TPA: acyl-CoA thioesterase [Planctomycetota bacterium]|nr:acyl-CoA thioesterase [Planctomycetota bacterium]